MIKDDKISILKVEAVQLVTGLLRIHDIFVDYKDCPFSSICGALTDLSNGAEFAKEIEQLLGADIIVEILDEECPRWRTALALDRWRWIQGKLPVDFWSQLPLSAHDGDLIWANESTAWDW